jgi:hypothetical protein
MKYRILPVIILLFIAGCKNGVPKNYIQPDEMSKILFDIHMVDSYLNTIPYPDSSKKVGASYYKGIYKKFDIDSALYTRSMNYYADHPDELSEIYKTVTSELTKQKTSIVKADSLVTVKLKKAAALKLKKDSLKTLDSMKRFPAFKKKILLKKAAALKRIDSIRKADSIRVLPLNGVKTFKKNKFTRPVQVPNAKKPLRVI